MNSAGHSFSQSQAQINIDPMHEHNSSMHTIQPQQPVEGLMPLKDRFRHARSSFSPSRFRYRRSSNQVKREAQRDEGMLQILQSASNFDTTSGSRRQTSRKQEDVLKEKELDRDSHPLIYQVALK